MASLVNKINVTHRLVKSHCPTRVSRTLPLSPITVDVISELTSDHSPCRLAHFLTEFNEMFSLKKFWDLV